jgi:hypothetical protein
VQGRMPHLRRPQRLRAASTAVAGNQGMKLCLVDSCEVGTLG